MNRKWKKFLTTILVIILALLAAMSLSGCGGKHVSIADYITDMENTVSLCIGEYEMYNNCFVEVSEQEKTEIIEYLTDLNLDNFEEVELSGVSRTGEDEYIHVRLEYEGFELGKNTGELYSIEFIEQESGQYLILSELMEGKTVLKADKGTLDMEEIKSEIEKHMYENCDNPDYEPDIKYDESITTFVDYLPGLTEPKKVWLYNPVVFTGNFNHVESEAQEDILNTLLSLNLESFKPYETMPSPPWDLDSNSDQVRVRVALNDASGNRSNVISVFNGEDGLYAYIKDERGLYVACLKGDKDAFDYDALEKKMNGYLE